MPHLGVRGWRLAAVAAAAVVLLYAWWVATAPSIDPEEALANVGGAALGHAPYDAVVVHAGGRNDRLPHALDLMGDGLGTVLVIMRGDTPTWPAARSLCHDETAFEVVCPFPEPDTTIGESRQLRTLVESRGWTSVVSVTSDYHLRRATLLDRRCNPGLTVDGSASNSGLPVPVWFARLAKEMAGMVQAAFIDC